MLKDRTKVNFLPEMALERQKTYKALSLKTRESVSLNQNAGEIGPRREQRANCLLNTNYNSSSQGSLDTLPKSREIKQSPTWGTADAVFHQLDQAGFPPSQIHKVAPIFFYKEVKHFFIPGVQLYHQDIYGICLLSFICARALTSWSFNTESTSLGISGRNLRKYLLFLFLQCLSSASRNIIRQTWAYPWLYASGLLNMFLG